MRGRGRRALYVPVMLLTLALALAGCAESVLLTTSGDAVEVSALPGGLAAAQEAAGADIAADLPEPAVTAAPDAAGADPAPADLPEDDALLSVGPGFGEGESSAAQAVAIWSGLQQLRQTLLDHPVRLAVPNILQNPELPNGCEITSAAIVLNYLGVPADKIVLARDYLPKGEYYRTSDPEKEFMGSPFAGEIGDYCMPGPVVKAVNDYLADVGRTDLQAQEISGAGLTELKQYLHEGTPVVVWVTQHFEDPRPDLHFTLPDGGEPYANLHCVVLTGYDENKFYLTDPLAQSKSQSSETFSKIYEGMGRRAMVIVPR